ncbi:hypothetical protein [Lysobacter sp. Hz 25]|uniref:hypothetical protein n=1 Tax=Lysobacter sp. Hz 25 TaxID=3383698 RepID=UPI0038D37051
MSLRISACALRSAPLLAALWFAASGAHAQTANETRLREALRETGARLRSAEAALAAQQAATAAAERERDALKAQAGKSAVRDDGARVAALQRQLGQASSASEQARANAQKWQAAQQQAAQLAQQKDGERAALATRLEAAEAQAVRCAADSEALYATGQEIAGLYRDPQFIDFVRDRGFEPLGLDRVKHENRVRALEDKLAEQGEQAARCRNGEAGTRTAGS